MSIKTRIERLEDKTETNDKNRLLKYARALNDGRLPIEKLHELAPSLADEIIELAERI